MGGKKQNPTPQLATNFNASRAAANEMSPAEQRLNEMALKTLNWADKGDFTNPRDGGVFVNFADPAAMRRRRELSSGAAAQGTAALGAGANPNLLALDKQNRDDENARDDAENYQNQVAAGVRGAMGVAGDVSRTALQRRLGVLGADAGLYGQSLAKVKTPSWWERLLGGAAQAGTTAAMSAVGL